MSTANTSSLHMVSKRNLSNILKNGFSKQSETDIPKDERLYLNIRNDQKDAQENIQEDTEKPISPENVRVVVLRNKKTKKLTTSPEKIDATMAQLQEGVEMDDYEIKAIPLNQYMEKMRTMQLQEFQKKIQSRDNYHLADVALLISTANKNHDTELLSQMIELIKFDPNYQFAFNGGKLDLNKLYEMGLMDRATVQDGMDKIENIEARGGDIDSTEVDADKIAEYSDKTVSEIEQSIEQEIPEEETENDTEQYEENANTALTNVSNTIGKIAKGVSKALVVTVLARIENLRQRIKTRITTMRNRNNAKENQNKEKSAKNEVDRDDNEFNPNKKETEKDRNKDVAKKENSREIESRQQREKFEREIAIKKIEEKIEKGKDLNPNEQKLYQTHLDEKSQAEKNVLGNTLDIYSLQNNKEFQERTKMAIEQSQESLSQNGELKSKDTNEKLEEEMELV